jgi:hypothetical protein
MPEQITKYPEVTLKVLKGSGARCGEGAQQKILKQCPAGRFCSLPAGELCVYGIEDIPRMTQITTQELAQVVCPVADQNFSVQVLLSATDGMLAGAMLLAGIAIGHFWAGRNRNM